MVRKDATTAAAALTPGQRLLKRVDDICTGKRSRTKAKPQVQRTAAGGYLACPYCGQQDGFTQRESVTSVRTVLFNGGHGTIINTDFECQRPSNTGKCDACGGVFRVCLPKKTVG